MTNKLPTVVVIDDSPASIRLYRRSSTLLDIDLKTFTSSAESLSYLADHSADLVFLDILMRDIDGLWILKQLRDMDRHQDTVVVIVTSKDYAQDRNLAQQLGSREYLVKPLRSQEIRAIIRRYTALKGRHRQDLILA